MKFFPFDILWFDDPFCLPFVTFWLLWTIFAFYNIFLFIKLRNTFYLQTRSRWLTVSSSIGQIGTLTFQSWKVIMTPEHYPNFFDLLFLWIFIPLHFIPYPLRALHYIFKFKISEAYVKEADDKENQIVCDDSCSCFKFWLFFGKHQNWIQDWSFFIYMSIGCLCAFIFMIVRFFSHDENQWGNYGTGIGELSYKYLTIFISSFWVFLLITYIAICRIKEEFGYAKELLATLISWAIFAPIFIYSGWHNLYDSSFPSIISPITGAVLSVLSFMISFGYPVSLAHSNKKLELIDIPQFKTVEDVLNDEYAHKLFRNFLQKCYATENILFLENVRKFRTLTTTEAIQKEAEMIINEYLKKGANRKLNLRDDKKIHAFIEDFPHNLSTNMFDNIYNEVSKILKNDKLGDFLTNDHEMVSYISQIRIADSIQTHRV